MTRFAELRKNLAEQPWELWTRQIAAILRMDLRKNFLSRRGIWIYLLALAPVVVITLHAILNSPNSGSMHQDTEVLAGIFQFFYLRFGIFFGCLGIFTWLFRGEVIEKSLHYYFLAPVKREVLLVGKFFGGLITAVTIFSAGVFASFAMMYVRFGPAGQYYVFNGPGMGQLLAYLGVTVLACIGYGSVFLALSLLMKNPVIPAVLVLGWETFNPVLPSLVQRFSVTYYLKQLCPVSIPAEGLMALFTVVSEPVSTLAAILGPIVLATLVLLLAAKFVRRFEISYVAE
ncbi:MAG: ABC transporter permease [Terriglobales bacterium]|jgi:ABC-type transport system involved in multi-copper enzyme maturation permease subunit